MMAALQCLLSRDQLYISWSGLVIHHCFWCRWPSNFLVQNAFSSPLPTHTPVVGHQQQGGLPVSQGRGPLYTVASRILSIVRSVTQPSALQEGAIGGPHKLNLTGNIQLGGPFQAKLARTKWDMLPCVAFDQNWERRKMHDCPADLMP